MHKKGEPCPIDSCGSPIRQNGMCSKHCSRFAKYGCNKTTRHFINLDEPNKIRQRILEGIAINPDSQCWEWKGPTHHSGYVHIRCGGRKVNLHRLAAYVWKDMPIDSPLFVCHQCDNRKCCNPDHLFLGTAKANSDDMWRKGRGNVTIYGEKNHLAKLTENAVREIRVLARMGQKQRDIAKKYGVAQSQIWSVLSGKTWSQVSDP